VFEDIQLALKTLHDVGLDFGDVRRPDIMVLKTRNEHGGKEWHVRLVDFDWSRPVCDARYRPTPNKNTRWARSVEVAHVIEKLRLCTDG